MTGNEAALVTEAAALVSEPAGTLQHALKRR